MRGDEVRQVFAAMRPQAAIDRLGEAVGVIARQRQLHLGRFGRAMGIAAGAPGGASQAEAVRAYRECAVPSVARSACARWFDAPLARVMDARAPRVLAYAQAQPLALSGPLRGVTEWDSGAATTVAVRDALRAEVPGTGDDAAITGPTVRSVGCGAPVRDHGSPARAPDRRQLTSDASWRDCGLLAALADASLDRLRACEAHGVRGVSRLPDPWEAQGRPARARAGRPGVLAGD